MTRIKLILAASAIATTAFIGSAQATIVATDDAMIEREASEGPRGGDNERRGDRQRRGRGGKAIETFDQLAREASEGPRGGDNERRGDRQRRGHA
jgi:hypothetical protein